MRQTADAAPPRGLPDDRPWMAGPGNPKPATIAMDGIRAIPEWK